MPSINYFSVIWCICSPIPLTLSLLTLWGKDPASPTVASHSPPDTDADLTFDQTAWGDSGVYYCSVVSAQDLQGNNEAYAELIVLGEWAGPRGPGNGRGKGAFSPTSVCLPLPSNSLFGLCCLLCCPLTAPPVTWAYLCPAP